VGSDDQELRRVRVIPAAYQEPNRSPNSAGLALAPLSSGGRYTPLSTRDGNPVFPRLWEPPDRASTGDRKRRGATGKGAVGRLA
jgi:hypothetical protein